MHALAALLATALTCAGSAAALLAQTPHEFPPTYWIREFRGGTTEERAYAAWALAQHGPTAIPQLERALGDAEPRVRICALDGLGHLGRAAADSAPAVHARRADPDPDVRRHAELAHLRVTAKPDRIAHLIAHLEAEEWDAQLAAADALASLDLAPEHPQAAPLLQALIDVVASADKRLDHTEYLRRPEQAALPRNVRQVAALAVGRLGPVDGCDALPALVAATQHKTLCVQLAALTALAAQPELHARSIRVVVDALDSPHQPCRELALSTLLEWAPIAIDFDAILAGAAVRVLYDSPQLRATALRLLTTLGPRAQSAIEPLMELVEQWHKDSAPAAARALLAIDADGSLATRLLEHLASRVESANGGESAGRDIEGLVAALADARIAEAPTGIDPLDRELRARAEDPAQRDRRYVARALADLTSPNGATRHAAHRTLARRRQLDVVPQLVALTGAAHSDDIRHDALSTLLQLDAVEAAPSLRPVLDAASVPLRASASWVLMTFEDAPSRARVLEFWTERIADQDGTACREAALTGLPGLYPQFERILLDAEERMNRRLDAGNAILAGHQPLQRSTFEALAERIFEESVAGPTGTQDRPRRRIPESRHPLYSILLEGLLRTDTAGDEQLIQKCAALAPSDPCFVSAAITTARRGDVDAIVTLIRDDRFQALFEATLDPDRLRVLSETRIRASQLLGLSVPAALEIIAARTGLPIVISDNAAEQVRGATFTLMYPLIGTHPTALAALGGLNHGELLRAPYAFVIADDEHIRLVSEQERSRHYARWLAARLR